MRSAQPGAPHSIIIIIILLLLVIIINNNNPESDEQTLVSFFPSAVPVLNSDQN